MEAGKKRRNSSPKEPSISSLFLILLFVLAVYILFLSDFFKIGEIKVTGIQRLTAEEIIIFCGLDSPKNFFQTDGREVQRKLAEHPLLKNSVIKKRFPRSIEIMVEEREPFFLLPYGKQLLVISKDLVVIYIHDARNESKLPIVTGLKPGEMHLGKPVYAEHIREASFILNEAAPGLLKKISEIHIDNEGLLHIYLNGQTVIEVGSRESLAKKIHNLNLLWKHQKIGKGKVYLQDAEHPVASESL